MVLHFFRASIFKVSLLVKVNLYISMVISCVSLFVLTQSITFLPCHCQYEHHYGLGNIFSDSQFQEVSFCMCQKKEDKTIIYDLATKHFRYLMNYMAIMPGNGPSVISQSMLLGICGIASAYLSHYESSVPFSCFIFAFI